MSFFVGLLMQVFHRLFYWCIMPWIALRIVLDIIRIGEKSWRPFSIILPLSVISWTYLNAIFLSSCSLFHLICALTTMHFDDFDIYLDKNGDTRNCFDELDHLYNQMTNYREIQPISSFFIFCCKYKFDGYTHSVHEAS